MTMSKIKTLFCAALAVSGVVAVPTPLQKDARDIAVRNVTHTTVPAPTPSAIIIDGGELSRAELESIVASNPRPNATVEKRSDWHYARKVVTTVSAPSITPAIVDGGTLSPAEIAALTPLQPNASTTIPTRKRNVDVEERANVDDVSPFLTAGWGNYTVATKNYTVEGPFQYIKAVMGSSNMINLTFTDLSGKVTEVNGGRPATDSTTTQEYTFKGNERISEMNIQGGQGDMKYPMGFSFSTDAKGKFNATPAVGIIRYDYQPNGGVVDIGSGIIGRIRTATSENGFICAFEVDMIDVVSDISISKIDYSGFTNNVAPTGEGNTVITGSEILDNTNSTIQQSLSLQTTSALMKSQTVTITNDFTYGASLSIAAEVQVPFVTKSTATVGTHWSLGKTTAEADATTTTVTNAATYTLACPAKKFCQASSFFVLYNLDVDFNCTFTASTKKGGQYRWGQSGNYKGASSTTIQQTLREYSEDPNKK